MNPKLQLRVPPDVIAWLERVGEEEGGTPNEVARRILTKASRTGNADAERTAWERFVAGAAADSCVHVIIAARFADDMLEQWRERFADARATEDSDG